MELENSDAGTPLQKVWYENRIPGAPAREFSFSIVTIVPEIHWYRWNGKVKEMSQLFFKLR